MLTPRAVTRHTASRSELHYSQWLANTVLPMDHAPGESGARSPTISDTWTISPCMPEQAGAGRAIRWWSGWKGHGMAERHWQKFPHGDRLLCAPRATATEKG